MKMKIPRVFIFILFLTVVFSCVKDNCETWEYTRQCEEKVSGACNGWNPATKLWAYLCDDELDGIHAGAAIVVTDDAERKVTRYYIRKVE